MKRALRIILPLVLILVILVCTAWYFLIYDPGFTQELLLQQARRQEDLGHYKVSTFLYDVAYFQSNQDDNVAIELANQYLSTGNYTKAEYTISQAIRTNPSADLYTALCDLYVQQQHSQTSGSGHSFPLPVPVRCPFETADQGYIDQDRIEPASQQSSCHHPDLSLSKEQHDRIGYCRAGQCDP